MFAGVDWLRYRPSSGLLHEEAPLVCAEEQENRLQASQVKRKQHTTARVRGWRPSARTAVKVHTNSYN